MTYAASFAAVGVAFLIGHNLADHAFGQTDRQAAGKSQPGRPGWLAALAHAAQYQLVVAVVLVTTLIALSVPVSPWGAFLGQALSFGSHTVIDRRWPVRWLLEHTGSSEYAKNISTFNGMYLADQAIHAGFLWLAALITVRPVAGLAVTGLTAAALTAWIVVVRHRERTTSGR